MILTKEKTNEILTKVLKYCQSDSAHIALSGDDQQYIRYANNMITTNLSQTSMNLNVSVAFGKKNGSSSTNQFDNKSLEACVRKAEQIARYAPPDPEFMPPLPPQSYKDIPAYIKETAEFGPEEKTRLVMDIIEHGKKKDMTVYGTLSNSGSFFSIANSNGLFGYHKYTTASATTTARTKDGSGSNRMLRETKDIRKLDPVQLGQEAIQRAIRSQNPKEIDPGDYTVVFDPEAVADYIIFLFFAIDARAADEGRSFMSTEDGKSKLGIKVFGDNVVIKTQADHPDLLAYPFDYEGLPVEEIAWIDKGVVKNLHYSRYWAKQKGKKPTSFTGGLVMEGGTHTMDDLIKSVKRGIYVQRLFYMRVVDPMKLLVTGLTRDGLFLIEDGKIKHPVVNLRFNESLESLLNNITMMTKPQIVKGSEFEITMLAPGAKIENFTFTSIAPSV
jgi:predicted Zn-dependent protease